MSNDEVIAALGKLIDGMVYISESDYELDLQEWGKPDKSAVLQKIATASDMDESEVNEVTAEMFFDKTIKALDPEDDFAADLAKQYKALYDYLQKTFKEVSVYRAGKIQVQIYITCFTNEGDCVAIHTTSVET